MYFSSSHGTSASFASRCARERASRAAKWHQSGGVSGHAAACGGAIISDVWPGLAAFFAPGTEILLTKSANDVLAALSLSDAELGRIATAARERTLAEHTSDCRADELLSILAARPSLADQVGHHEATGQRERPTQPREQVSP